MVSTRSYSNDDFCLSLSLSLNAYVVFLDHRVVVYGVNKFRKPYNAFVLFTIFISKHGTLAQNSRILAKFVCELIQIFIFQAQLFQERWMRGNQWIPCFLNISSAIFIDQLYAQCIYYECFNSYILSPWTNEINESTLSLSLTHIRKKGERTRKGQTTTTNQ